MDFRINEEEQALADQVYRLSKEQIAPGVRAREEAATFPWEMWQLMADFGLLGLPYPEEYGGLGTSALATCLCSEAMAYGGAEGGLTLSWGAHMILCGVPIWKIGTDEQKKRYLPGIASGKTIGAFCLTEPDAGSDATGMRTRAVQQGDRYILNGSKTFITNAPLADVFIVTAVTTPGARSMGISAFIVERDAPGLSIGKPFEKLGNRVSPTAEVFFDDCEVPAENLLGSENSGFVQVAYTILGWERSCLLAPAVGGIRFLLDLSARYALERKQFRRPIAEFQGIQRKIAEMKMAYEVSRLMVYRVAAGLDRGEVPMVDAAMAKLYVSEQLVRVAEESVQIHGGYGYLKEYLPELSYRDAKLATIGAGTSEIQKSIIAQSLMKIR